jgi:hypothetical protein
MENGASAVEKLRISPGGVTIATRPTSSTNGINEAIQAVHKTSGDMVDGFGSAIALWHLDNSATYYLGGRIATVRNGSDATSDMVFYVNDAANEVLRISTGGNLGLGTSTFGTNAATVLAIANGTAPTTSPANSIQLYAEDVAASSELKVRDEATNITTLSPHNFSLIGLPSEPGAWSFYGEYTNKETGEREAVNVDMLKVIRLIEQITGEKLVYKTTIKK